jgi:acetyltransferase-like isoleucine patch superfamily enzyme
LSLQQDVAFEDHDWLHLRATERVSRAFSSLNLFIAYQVRTPVNPDFIIRIPKAARFENFTSSSGQLYSAGAFSYSENGETHATIGRYCSVGGYFSIMGERHPLERVTTSSFTYCYFPDYNKPQFLRGHEELLGNAYPPKKPENIMSAPPRLEHDVWIGQQVIMQRGITVHTGSVVGAGSVVTRDVPPYTVVAGNPARPIRTRFAPELRDRLLASEWWNFHPRVLFEFGYDDVERFCERMEAGRANGSLAPAPFRSLDWKDVLAAMEEV